MLVKMLTAMASMTDHKSVGEIVELSDDTAQRLIDTGQAILAPPVVTPAKTAKPAAMSAQEQTPPMAKGEEKERKVKTKVTI